MIFRVGFCYIGQVKEKNLLLAHVYFLYLFLEDVAHSPGTYHIARLQCLCSNVPRIDLRIVAVKDSKLVSRTV